MKKLIFLLILGLWLGQAGADNRYWVGNGSTTSWNAVNPTNWANTSGGSNNQTKPTSITTVYFDSLSPNCHMSSGESIGSIDFTDYNGTIENNGSAGIGFWVNGSLKFSSTMGYYSNNLGWAFEGKGNFNITTTGKALNVTTFGNQFHKISYGNWTFTDALVNGGDFVIRPDNAVGTTIIKFTDGTVNNVTSFTIVNADATHLVILTGTGTAGWAINDTTGTNYANWTSISYSTAGGGATWNATNSTNVTGNSGWNFITGGFTATGKTLRNCQIQNAQL